MSIMDLDGFNYDNIKNELLGIGKDAYRMISIVDLTYSDYGQDLFNELNNKFDSNVGNRAYPREMLYMVMSYCFELGINNYDDIARACRTNKVLEVVTRGKKPCGYTFRRFLDNTDHLLIKQLFLCSLVDLNDLEFLKFLHLFIDSTDGIVRGSRNYTINNDKIKAFELLNKHNLLHDNTKSSKKRLLERLECILKENDGDTEIEKLTRLIKRNLDLFNKRNYSRIPDLKKILEEENRKTLSITFPDSVLMKTKNGRFDFAFNIHTVLTDNKIMLTGLVSNKANDDNCIEDLLGELIENLYLLLDLQEKYGKRKNYKEIEQALDNAIFIFDSGYFELENLKAIDKHNINAIILSRKISRQINNQIREDNNIPSKTKNKQNPEKESRKSLKQVPEGYICKNGKLLKLTRQWEIQKRDNSQKELPEQLRENTYEYTCSGCSRCPYHKTCNLQTVQDIMTPLEYEMTKKSLKQRYQKIYKHRFHCSEGINGFLKIKNGILKFIGTTTKAVQNELYLRGLYYNIIRKTNLKDTIY